MQEGAQPVRVKLLRYTAEQRDFLRRFVGRLLENDLANRNPRATWCSAPLLVPKTGPDGYRFTVDLRPVNRVTVLLSWPMPHLESELSRLVGSKVFATFGLSHGYWQLAWTNLPRTASLS